MNICIVLGKIISDIEYEFIITEEKKENNKKINKLNSKNISVCKFEIELINKSIVKIKAYNEKADYCYKSLYAKNEEGKYIVIEGRLNNNIEIELENLIKI